VTGWVVLLRGIRHRAGRSAVVAVLAAVAVAAAVLTPGFSRAAQQSVLTDGLTSATPAATALTVGATGTAGGAPAAHETTGDTRLVVAQVLADAPVAARVLGQPVGGVDTRVQVHGGSESLATRLAYRDGVCDELHVVDGDCPIDAGQVLVSARTAEEYAIGAGDTVTVEFAETERALQVVGTYRPTDPGAPYWGRTAYFAHGGFDPTTGAPQVDAMFTVAETDVQADPQAVVQLSLTYPLAPGAVRLDDVDALRADLATLDSAVRIADRELHTALPAILDDIAADQAAIGRTAPIVAAPLLLLAWFTLFLLVALLTEERGREIALAKLRGFTGARAARFGLGEVLLLILAAAPVGVLAGLGAVELASRLALAEGTHVELRPPVFLAAGAALAAAALAAVLAARRTLRREVLALLRRVPPRTGWRVGAAEAAVVTLAVASLVVAAGDRTSGLAMLAPALLAVVAGIVAARAVRWWSALRLRLARRRGNLPGLLSAAHLSRRPAGARTVVVVTAAVALLSFAAVAWDVAAQARHDHAVDRLGADRVYSVVAEHPTALRQAVRAADPDGTAMAVVRSSEQYGGEPVELLAVETPLLADIARWRGYHPDRAAEVAAALQPPTPAALSVSGELEVAAQVSDLGEPPVRLSALVSTPGQPPQAVSLGTLTEGSATYGAGLPRCGGDGCRLLGLVLGRTGAAGGFTATVEISRISSSGNALTAGFDDPDRWHAGGAGSVTLTPGSALTVEVGDGHEGDLVVRYVDTAPALPAVLAGPAPADQPGGLRFDFPGFAERPESFTVVDSAERLPRVGTRGLLFDLEHAVSSAERTAALSERTLTYEVWASDAAPADLAQRLTAAGVSVQGAESVSGTLAQLTRRAPALGFWLYLLAAAAAVALAAGVVALSSRLAVEHRMSELAALRTSGVGAGVLRRALLREQVALLGWPLLIGAGAGLAAAVLMLPGIPLVEVGTLTSLPAYRIGAGAVPVAAAATVVGLAAAALRALRLPHRALTRPPREAEW
jgi:putative ABC transport system permease protein